jgi:choline/glycine/proline betaine transport protein
VVFYTSAGLILLFSLMTIFFAIFLPSGLAHPELGVPTFGWYYLLAATLYIVFVVCIACSRFGSVKLGPEQSKPEFSLLSWAAMLFAAGIGIDLMFFSVAEPVTQYMQPPEGAGQTMEAARQAMVWTLFHYGLTGWSMYALMGMALGYFSYRYNLPSPSAPRSTRSSVKRLTAHWPQRRYRGGDRHHLRYRHHARDWRGAAQLRAERAV